MLFLFLFLSFCLRVIRKGLRKNSEIFVNLRRSSGQSVRERCGRLPEFLVFKSVPGCIEGISGHYGMFRVIMGCSRGVPELFRAVPGCSGLFRAVPVVFRGCSGVFRGCSGVFRGCSGVFRGVPGVFRLLQTPNLEYDYYSLSSVVFSAFGSRVVWPCFGSLSFGKVSSKAWPRGAVHEVISSR